MGLVSQLQSAVANFHEAYMAEQTAIRQESMQFLQTIDSLLENFGAEAVGNAATQKFLLSFADGLRDMVDNSNLPEAAKQMAHAMIDQHLADMGVTCPCSTDVSTALENSEMATVVDGDVGDVINQMIETTGCVARPSFTEVLQPVLEAALTTAAPQATCGSANQAAAEAAAESANEGTSTVAENTGFDNPVMDEIIEQIQDDSRGEREDEEGSGSFLIALARAMGETQGKLLKNAMEHSKTMVTYSGKDDAESAAKFTDAQAKYAGHMQLFNLYSTQVATTIKTLGEAMSSIARKQ